LVGFLDGRLIGWLVGWFNGWLVGWLVVPIQIPYFLLDKFFCCIQHVVISQVVCMEAWQAGIRAHSGWSAANTMI
jgi:hypothetical protein